MWVYHTLLENLYWEANTPDNVTFHEKEIWASLWSFRVLTGLFIKIRHTTKRLKILSALTFICIKYRKYQSCLSLNLMFETFFLQMVTCKVLSKVLFDFFSSLDTIKCKKLLKIKLNCVLVCVHMGRYYWSSSLEQQANSDLWLAIPGVINDTHVTPTSCCFSTCMWYNFYVCVSVPPHADVDARTTWFLLS